MTQQATIEDEAVHLLAPLAAKAGAKPLHWISGDDESEDFCFDCARIIARRRRRRGDRQAKVDGGWGSESDGAAFCSLCGCLLEHSLTDYGVEAELEAYEDDQVFDFSYPSTAYHLENVIDHGRHIDELRERIEALAKKVVVILKRGI